MAGSRLTWWVLLWVAIGLGLRLYHWGRDPGMWHDEAAAVLNVLDKDYAEHFGPLYCANPSPPLFLWVEKAATGAFGDGTRVLRLFPFLASCGTLLGMVWVGRRVMKPRDLVWLVVLVACSDRLLWHACEAKPYAVDALVAVLLMLTMVGPGRRLAGMFLLYALASPLLLFLSYPAIFLLAAAAMLWLPVLCRSRSVGAWLSYGLFVMSLVASFAAVYFGPIRAQQVADLMNDWRTEFPDWSRWWTIPGNLVLKGTEVFRYALEPTGNLLVVVALMGLMRWRALWWRQHSCLRAPAQDSDHDPASDASAGKEQDTGLVQENAYPTSNVYPTWLGIRRRVLAFALLPMFLLVLAWLVGKYPLGAKRVVMFLAPGALLLIALGIAPALAWLRRRHLLAAALLLGLLLFPVAQTAFRVMQPWKRLDSLQPATFVMHQRQGDEPVVGTTWEHAYYFRTLGSAFRFLKPSALNPPAPSPASSVDGTRPADRLWLIARPKDFGQRHPVSYVEPAQTWIAQEQFSFPDFTVYFVTRRE